MAHVRRQDRTGWYLPSFFEGFREILRLKFMAITAGSTVSDLELVDYIAKLPSGAELEQDRAILRAEALKRATTAQTEGEGDGEQIAVVSGKLKRKTIRPKSGVKPKPKTKDVRPSIIDRLAPHLNGQEMEEDEES
jgi:hypothetical protein